MTNKAEVTLRWAWRLLDSLAGAGVKHAVISPGSRSTPLALAVLRHPNLRVDVVTDERSAAFYALGLAKGRREPSALIATSGSAPANWFPAVVEADMARVPLVLLSADRPPELQNCGANQTMDQLALFGGHVRAFHQLPLAEEQPAWLTSLAGRAVGLSLWPLPGPVHINVPLREPLVAQGQDPLVAGALPPQELANVLQPAPGAIDLLNRIVSGRCGAIMCGPDALGGEFRIAVVRLALRLNVPLFADVLSGIRFCVEAGEQVLAHPDQVARTAPAADWILRFGGTPVSRGIEDWLKRCQGCHQIVVADHPRIADPSGTATHILRAAPETVCEALGQAGPAPASWLHSLVSSDRAAAAAAAKACADDALFEGAVLRALAEALPEESPIFLGNSLTVRAADWFAGRKNKHLRLFGNRGVSGIDGNLSTAFGIAAALGPTVAVTGDLAFLHDLNALSLGHSKALTVLVLDNGGGGIFGHLPQSALPEFEQGWLAPQRLDPVEAARSFGLTACRVTGVKAAIDAVLSHLNRPAASVIHVPIDRGLSLNRCRDFFASCQQGA
jgi:2-succinyl-5-enolpyruvyl-6-hydroxy-3-cyclohexene-1-carboxylate synthase